MVKNMPAVQEMLVLFLGLEDPLEKKMATHPHQLSCLGNLLDRGTWRATVNGVPKT